ncbi:Ivy1p [Rhodotorula paludigena]|uniref:Ivy1p n=1 Tax=Rhodotorula paludigena TaxID=86838 RepID=UPI003170D144
MAPSIRSFRGANHPPSSYKDPQLSPTLSAASTRASQLDFGEVGGPRVVVTRADLRESVAAYEQLLACAKAYRNALHALSGSATALAGALGECARVKGAGESGEGLLAASGLHYMVANSGQVLSDTLYRSFEVPLMTAYDSYVADIAARHAEYEALLKEKTAKIRETEAENMRRGKKKSRDLNQFRAALNKLQEQVAEVEVCKRTYYSEVLENETDVWSLIGGKVSLLVRSTMDLADRLASKATSDPVIESMLNEHPDPFDSYRLDRDEVRDVFTVLPPMNLGAGPSSAPLSKTGSMIEADKEAARPQEHDDYAVLTPKQLSKAPVSVSDVLGLNKQDDEDALTPRRREQVPRATTDMQDDEAPKGAASRSSHQPGHEVSHVEPAPSSSTASSPNVAPADSPALVDSLANSIASSVDPDTSLDAPSLTAERAPFSTGPSPSASPAPHSSSMRSSPRKSNARRRLSRVSEAQDPADPMAGDWGAPVYGRALSPGINGGSAYDSAEDEPQSGWQGA